jgi:hypothetical protein
MVRQIPVCTFFLTVVLGVAGAKWEYPPFTQYIKGVPRHNLNLSITCIMRPANHATAVKRVLRKHWGTVAPIAPASLIQGQAWTVIADIPRLWALHARTPTTASHCHSLLEPTLHPLFFDNTIP